MRIPCFFWHKWRYFAAGCGRQCQRNHCYEWQYKNQDGAWVHDELGSGFKREWEQWDDDAV